MPHDVFVSYPTEQKVTADAICATLERNGIRCWIAPRDILPGESFAAAIVRAIKQSRLLILVFSRDSNNSPHIKSEVGLAFGTGLSIVTVRVEDIVPSDEMEYYLSRDHWLDAVTPPIQAHIDELVGTVRVLLGYSDGGDTREHSQPPPSPAPRPRTRRWWYALCALPILAAIAVGADALYTRIGARAPTPPHTAMTARTTTPTPRSSPAPPAAERTSAATRTSLLTPAQTQATALGHTATPDPNAVALASDVNLLLVRVPAGDFTMGSTEADLQAESDEMPQHAVYLDEYQIGKYEVTVAQWRAFVEATGYPADSRALADPDDRPVRYVSWDDAVAFCEWASIVTGRSVRLPTEAQWEKAARGTDARIYPWGSNAPSCSLCNFRHGSNYCAGDTSAVGSSSPQGDSIYGCADMAGNVWEWARDSYASNYYGQPSAGTNPTGPASGDSHVLRGGSWNSGAGYVRAADRAKYAPDTRYDGLGFRVCVSPIQL